MRSRVLDFRTWQGAAESLGECQANLPKLCGYLNESIWMLLEAGGEVGWWGTWGRVVFNVTACNPYLTLPRSIARVINAAICKNPVHIQNGLYEVLEYGVGPQLGCSCSQQIYDRGTFPTLVDLDNTGNPKVLRFYITDQRDIDKRILVQAIDSNGAVLRSLDNGIDVQGVYIRFQSPFVDTEFTLGANKDSKITGFQKDVLVGDLRVYSVDTETGEQTALSVFEPTEKTPCYRRYFLGGLPTGCCPGQTTIQVTAQCKFAFFPVSTDQDWLLIGNIPALERACESVRYGRIDSRTAQAMSKEKWRHAIRLLNAEIDHHMGKQKPAINFAPFGNDRLEYVLNGMT